MALPAVQRATALGTFTLDNTIPMQVNMQAARLNRVPPVYSGQMVLSGWYEQRCIAMRATQMTGIAFAFAQDEEGRTHRAATLTSAPFVYADLFAGGKRETIRREVVAVAQIYLPVEPFVNPAEGSVGLILHAPGDPEKVFEQFQWVPLIGMVSVPEPVEEPHV